MPDSQPHPFESLSPDLLIDAVESLGFVSDGRFLALNSYENRVYQIGIERRRADDRQILSTRKWSREQILEEHEFCFELVEQELPVVAPWKDSQETAYTTIAISVLPSTGAKLTRAPELDNLDNLFILGRLMGRIHGIGATRPFQHRPHLDSQGFGWDSYRLISEQFIPDELRSAYDSLAIDLLNRIEDILKEYGPLNPVRVHGDCHSGNILWRDDNPHFVDFDDVNVAPAIQDLWMLLSGERHEQCIQMAGKLLRDTASSMSLISGSWRWLKC